jgi:hypothetical protein
MAKAKPPAGPERVNSKSFNGAKRGTVLRRWTSPTPDSYFGADFALVEFDHHHEPIWSSTKFLAKPFKADLYEAWRAAPMEAVAALVKAPTEDVLRACARIAGGQRTHHTGSLRWTGLVRHLPLAQGTEVLLTLFERLQRDPAVEAFHAPAVLDGSEYNKADFKYGPNVIGADVVGWLHDGLTRYWRYPCGDGEATVVDRLPAELGARAQRALRGTFDDGRAHLRTPLTRPRIDETFGGVNREYNARVGLDGEFPMVMGTGY